MKNPKDIRQQLFTMMEKLDPAFKQKIILNEDEEKWIQKAVDPSHKGYCTPMTKDTCTPKRKALAKRFKKGIDEDTNLENTFNPEQEKIKGEKLKAAIDVLVESGEFEVIDTLYRLLVERKKPINKVAAPAIAEAGMSQNDTYFVTLSAALDAVRAKVEKKGFTVDEDDMFQQFGTGGINYLQTKSATIPLLRNGVPDRRRSVTITIYRMDSGRYELTSHIN